VELLESRFLRGKKKKKKKEDYGLWLVRTRLELGLIFANETETGIHSFEEPNPEPISWFHLCVKLEMS
jgi:hypothetical protein